MNISTVVRMDSFLQINFSQENILPIITVYNNPRDYPGKFLARIFNGVRPTNVIMVKDSLEEINRNIPGSMVWINRYPVDDPAIVGTWI